MTCCRMFIPIVSCFPVHSINSVRGEQVALGVPCSGPVDYLLKRVHMLKHYGVKPWVVMDGRRTPMKVLHFDFRQDYGQKITEYNVSD